MGDYRSKLLQRIYDDCSTLKLDYLNKMHLMNDIIDLQKEIEPPGVVDICTSITDSLSPKVSGKRYRCTAVGYQVKNHTFRRISTNEILAKYNTKTNDIYIKGKYLNSKQINMILDFYRSVDK